MSRFGVSHGYASATIALLELPANRANLREYRAPLA